MISSNADYQRTREYVERLQSILLALRKSSTTAQYELMSKAYLKELTKSQREIAMYLTTPAEVAQ